VTGDARFEDAAAGGPVRLRVESEADLAVVSALVQDAVTEAGEVAWMPKRRRFALLLNRFRWEDAEAARGERRAFERVRSVLTVDGALRVRAQGVDPAARDTVLSVLALGFVADPGGGGTLHVILAGDGAFAVEVECLDVSLADVSRPYLARAAAAPAHDLD
jgi:Protein of unknown function (DUF2948)